MKFKFSQMTGRLTAPPIMETPIKPTSHVQEAVIRYPLGTTFPKELPPFRNRGGYGAVPQEILKKIKIFQANNGLPVHVKGGPVDKILYGITAVACLVGMVDCCHVYYTLAYNPTKSE